MNKNKYKNIDSDVDMENNYSKESEELNEKYNKSNLIVIFCIREFLYLFIKVKNNISYDIINFDSNDEMNNFFNKTKSLIIKENAKEKVKKYIKNEEYFNSLFLLQNTLIKYCPNFTNQVKNYYYSHNCFIEYIKTKINKYSLKINENEIINWLFEEKSFPLKYKKNNDKNKKYKLISIDDYKNKFIHKFFFSDKFKFNFYDGKKENMFYYIPSAELSKIPLENIPILYNLVILRTLNVNYIQLDSVEINISITNNIFCLLNPKKDLKDTEKKILPFIKKNNINCIYSREPSDTEMEEIIKNKLFYIYCGHGDSSKYLKREYIEKNKINFLTFLFGCSSANTRLISKKDSQPFSAPQLFLKQKCPFFLGFLWPVSSKDLDNFTIELLEILFTKKEKTYLVKEIILLKRKFSLRAFNGGALVMYANSDIKPNFS